MKLVFFNRFFFPDGSATSQILSDLAFHFAHRGHDVHVVTSRSDPAQAARETVRGVTIHRVAEATSAPHSLAHRALAYFRFHTAARRLSRILIADGDVVVLKTDPPMLGATVGPIAARNGAAVVNWLQDIFPEVAERHGVPGARLGGIILRRLRDRSLRLAAKNVVICERMALHLEALGISPQKTVVIHNWANGRLVTPVPREENPLRKGWALDDAFVVAYSGNLGRVHEFDTLLDAAKELARDDGILILFVGKGPRLAEVKRRASAEGLSNVRFEPPQDRDLLSQSLGVGDVHVSTLQPRFEGLVHPSKLYGVMAAGRPTLFIGDPGGETARILEETKAGLTVRTGDAKGLAAAIRELRDDAELRRDMGRRSRQAFETRYDISVALAEWDSLLDSLRTRA